MRTTIISPQSFSIQAFLSYAECTQLIELAERTGFADAGVRTREGPKSMPAVRNNARAIVASYAWVKLIWERLGRCDLPLLDGQSPQGLPKDLRFYKYSAGQRFKMHKDGPWREEGMESKLTFLVYLNDAFVGGSTDFRGVSVRPETGSALLFHHDTWHAGAAVLDGTKYVLRSDVLYAPSAGP